MEQTPQSNPFATMHKQRLYSLIIAGVALISLFLPWLTISAFFASASANGFRSWGLLSFLGVVAVAVSAFMGNKALPYDAMFKNIVMAGFGAIALGALIFFLRISSIGGGYGRSEERRVGK